jgi:hypothetical protein
VYHAGGNNHFGRLCRTSSFFEFVIRLLIDERSYFELDHIVIDDFISSVEMPYALLSALAEAPLSIMSMYLFSPKLLFILISHLTSS